MAELESVLRSAVDRLGIRRTLERISRDITFWRTLPDRLGGARIKVSPECGLRYWINSLEAADTDLLRWAEDLVGDSEVVWDVGANLGIFSVAATSHSEVSDVIALEPDLMLASYLRQTIDENDLYSSVHLLPVAASDSEEIARFSISSRSRARNSLHKVDTGNKRYQNLVPAYSLDFLGRHLPYPNLIKIDVEGAELPVIRGATDLLQQSRPKIVCEVSAQNQFAVTRLFQQYDYELFDADDPAYPAIDQAAFNTLAVPFGTG